MCAGGYLRIAFSFFFSLHRMAESSDSSNNSSESIKKRPCPFPAATTATKSSKLSPAASRTAERARAAASRTAAMRHMKTQIAKKYKEEEEVRAEPDEAWGKKTKKGKNTKKKSKKEKKEKQQEEQEQDEIQDRSPEVVMYTLCRTGEHCFYRPNVAMECTLPIDVVQERLMQVSGGYRAFAPYLGSNEMVCESITGDAGFRGGAYEEFIEIQAYDLPVPVAKGGKAPIRAPAPPPLLARSIFYEDGACALSHRKKPCCAYESTQHKSILDECARNGVVIAFESSVYGMDVKSSAVLSNMGGCHPLAHGVRHPSDFTRLHMFSRSVSDFWLFVDDPEYQSNADAAYTRMVGHERPRLFFLLDVDKDMTGTGVYYAKEGKRLGMQLFTFPVYSEATSERFFKAVMRLVKVLADMRMSFDFQSGVRPVLVANFPPVSYLDTPEERDARQQQIDVLNTVLRVVLALEGLASMFAPGNFTKDSNTLSSAAVEQLDITSKQVYDKEPEGLLGQMSVTLAMMMHVFQTHQCIKDTLSDLQVDHGFLWGFNRTSWKLYLHYVVEGAMGMYTGWQPVVDLNKKVLMYMDYCTKLAQTGYEPSNLTALKAVQKTVIDAMSKFRTQCQRCRKFTNTCAIEYDHRDGDTLFQDLFWSFRTDAFIDRTMCSSGNTCCSGGAFQFPATQSVHHFVQWFQVYHYARSEHLSKIVADSINPCEHP
jgi:hypothetical protein